MGEGNTGSTVKKRTDAPRAGAAFFWYFTEAMASRASRPHRLLDLVTVHVLMSGYPRLAR